MDKKTNLFLTIYMGIVFSIVFTVVGGLLNGFDWKAIPVQFLVGLLVGVAVGLIIPVGDVGGAIAGKLCQPGTPGFTFIMFNVILLLMLVFMCPIMTVIFGCVMGGAPLAAVLPGAYSTFMPFYIPGSIVLQLIGNKVAELAAKTVHPSKKQQ